MTPLLLEIKAHFKEKLFYHTEDKISLQMSNQKC